MNVLDIGTGSEAPVILSVVIPAYNEFHRLPSFLSAAREYLDKTFGDRYEVIVVDDGSCDGTLDFVEAKMAAWPGLAVMRHIENRGKGAAVASGIRSARGELLMFADADGAASMEQESRLRAAILRGADIAIGARSLRAGDKSCFRALRRRLTGRLFSCAASAILGLSISDSQCGFKMFRHEVAKYLFENLTEAGFAFDLELLVLARGAGFRAVEVPITWSDVPGSKVNVLRDGPRMLKSVVAIRQRMRRVFPSSAATPSRRAPIPIQK